MHRCTSSADLLAHEFQNPRDLRSYLDYELFCVSRFLKPKHLAGSDRWMFGADPTTHIVAQIAKSECILKIY